MLQIKCKRQINVANIYLHGVEWIIKLANLFILNIIYLLQFNLILRWKVNILWNAAKPTLFSNPCMINLMFVSNKTQLSDEMTWTYEISGRLFQHSTHFLLHPVSLSYCYRSSLYRTLCTNKAKKMEKTLRWCVWSLIY